jgi:putative transposase
MIIDYLERYKNLFGVEPICTALTDAGVPIAPSTFYAARTRPASARAVRDEDLKAVIARVHEENYGVYGSGRCTPSSTEKRYSPAASRWRGAPPSG